MGLRREVFDLIRSDSFPDFVRLVTREDAIDPDGDTHPFGSYLHFCIAYGRSDMVLHLLKIGADINHHGGVWKATPMTYAAAEGNVAMVRLLRDHGAIFDTHSDPFHNPLIIAIREGHLPVVQYLLEAGLNPHVTYRVDRGKLRNAFTRAQDDKRPEILALLQSYGCHPPVEGVDQPVWEMPREEWTPETTPQQDIVEYMQLMFGPVDEFSLQEIIPVLADLSITINVIPPCEEHPFFVIFTNGMSGRPLNVPAGSEAWQYAELVMHLPPDWPHPREAGTDERWLWPVQLLRQLAYHPHVNQTWYGPPAALVANTDPPEPLGPNVRFTSALLVPRFANLRLPLTLDDGRVVNFFTVVPLHTDEREFGLKYGVEAFLKRFVERRVPMTVEIDRKSMLS